MAKKYALLIGNTDYDDDRLRPLNGSLQDIDAVAAVLNNPEICGFDEVIPLPNPSFAGAMRALSQLFVNKTKDDLLLFYFSGHGVKDVAGELFFAIQDTEWGLYDGTAIAASQLKNIVNKSRSQRQVLILDCCHSGAISNGFKAVDDIVIEETFDVKGYGREILTATGSLQYAVDGAKTDKGCQRSLFTHFLVEGLETGAAAAENSETITVEQLYQYVHTRVTEALPGITPVYSCDRAVGRINLAKNPRPVYQLPEDLLKDLIDANRPRLRIGALHDLRSIAGNGGEPERAAVLKVLKARKDEERDRFVHNEIVHLIADLKQSSNDRPNVGRNQTGKLEAPNKLQPGQVFRDSLKDGSKGPEMLVIPAGKFQMGDIQGGGDKSEKPVHEVIIAKPFALGKYPLTFAVYDAYCDSAGVRKPEDEGWGRDDRPVIHVSWNDATAYTVWLSDQTGKRYRLPSEAEWEYAARGGIETEYWWGDKPKKKLANFDGSKTNPVSQFESNPFGLHETLGNVWEWVEDSWHENYKSAPTDGSAWVDDGSRLRVLRGGSWYNEPNFARSANRYRYFPASSNDNVGFRLAQDL